jgi:hypothetical protein
MENTIIRPMKSMTELQFEPAALTAPSQKLIAFAL